MPHDEREHPTEHLGTARSRRAAIDAATRIYLDGGSLDMSALAEDLGVGRTTLYRWVGNREELLGTVLAEATVRTFRKAAADADRGGGVEHVLDVMHRFMRAVAAAPPLQALSKREHLLFIRLTMMPGPVETAAARMITEMLETEATAGRMTLPLPAAVLGQAIVRLCDAHLYANLLGRDEPEIETALGLAAALLGAPSYGSTTRPLPTTVIPPSDTVNPRSASRSLSTPTAASAVTTTFLSRIASRTTARGMIRALCSTTEWSTVARSSTRTPGDSTDSRTCPPDTITPLLTTLLTACPVRSPSSKTNFAGGWGGTWVRIGHRWLYRLNTGCAAHRSMCASK
jgi:AcrR family transcriptional regulator